VLKFNEEYWRLQNELNELKMKYCEKCIDFFFCWRHDAIYKSFRIKKNCKIKTIKETIIKLEKILDKHTWLWNI